jgi:hypothetical protein
VSRVARGSRAAKTARRRQLADHESDALRGLERRSLPLRSPPALTRYRFGTYSAHFLIARPPTTWQVPTDRPDLRVASNQTVAPLLRAERRVEAPSLKLCLSLSVTMLTIGRLGASPLLGRRVWLAC